MALWCGAAPARAAEALDSCDPGDAPSPYDEYDCQNVPVCTWECTSSTTQTIVCSILDRDGGIWEGKMWGVVKYKGAHDFSFDGRLNDGTQWCCAGDVEDPEGHPDVDVILIGSDNADEISLTWTASSTTWELEDAVPSGQVGAVSVYGSDGDDEITGNLVRHDLGKPAYYGEAGDDVILMGGQGAEAYGGAGADTIDGTGSADLIYGESVGFNPLLGGDDVLRGHGGVDVIYGGGGADVLCGGANDDELFGGYGGDELWAGTGAGAGDELDGEAGTDACGPSGATDVNCESALSLAPAECL
jgi:Ca2+-binding RTX toxin-like protein